MGTKLKFDILMSVSLLVFGIYIQCKYCFVSISALNGHIECLRLLMETADDNNIVDCTDALDRYLTALFFLAKLST